jgi:phosphatidate cytidylyltransferase
VLRRTITALIALIVVGGLLWVGKKGFLFLWGVGSLLLSYEWLRGERLSWLNIFIALWGLGLIWTWEMVPSLRPVGIGGGIFLLGAALFSRDPLRYFQESYKVAWGWLYIGIGWGSVMGLLYPAYDFYRTLAFLSLVWVADTVAYLVGKSVGRHRILPKISPNKTWEGFIGGVLATALYGHWAVEWAGGWAGLPPVVGGAATAVVAFWGDAWQSAWKRVRGLKDSGSLLPGHGGIWDRVDALLWVAPLWYFVR